MNGQEKIYDCPIDLKRDGFDYPTVFRVANKENARKTHKDYKWEFIKKIEDLCR